MQRRGNRDVRFAADDDDDYEYERFTYRPLSRLPTPPPTLSKPLVVDQSLEDDDTLNPRYRGPAIHLVNLIPASASLASASVPFVQAMLSRADLSMEMLALAVCILDSLDTKFARTWRLSCPLSCPLSTDDIDSPAAASPSLSKRHSLPPRPRDVPQRQLHIDSVRPEIIILAALQPPQFYRLAWGRGLWSNEQLNVTERCIMESLDYRILPLCEDDCLTDAMVDMQLAAELESGPRWNMARQPTPPDSAAGSDCEFVPSHSRSKTTVGVAFPSRR
ncbi:hypothetical protein BBK36DRAFT_1175775 [Trichoderma citrinoviride]|uniref:Cyclin N-terminal domain-containing protein n=1 Tax=Trichoderma citrinoviride TaxID=58853 RepID=A0A2T4BNJ2_9HYPO|nr:hypothetical protein BBK36DRAFT_1175775 [Trichoderma citrinoviride]PTB70856.1 hypothetical protein BBK36DRAFT_1175775 [Trichoderma citrinoviride]